MGSNLPKGTAFLREAYRCYRKNAKVRGLDFSLDYDQFVAMATADCWYCGAHPKIKLLDKYRNFKGKVPINGVDRINSKKGYFISNCVPCCSTCNRAKSAINLDDFLLWVGKIYENHKEFFNDSGHEVEDKSKKKSKVSRRQYKCHGILRLRKKRNMGRKRSANRAIH